MQGKGNITKDFGLLRGNKREERAKEEAADKLLKPFRGKRDGIYTEARLEARSRYYELPEPPDDSSLLGILGRNPQSKELGNRELLKAVYTAVLHDVISPEQGGLLLYYVECQSLNTAADKMGMTHRGARRLYTNACREIEIQVKKYGGWWLCFLEDMTQDIWF